MAKVEVSGMNEEYFPVPHFSPAQAREAMSREQRLNVQPDCIVEETLDVTLKIGFLDSDLFVIYFWGESIL